MSDRLRAMAEINDKGISQAVTWLSGGLVLLTASLGAVGGLTGGIARMFRNSNPLQIKIALGLVLLSVLLAVIAGVWKHPIPLVVLLTLGTISFGLGSYQAISLMVASSRVQDRPAISAQLTFSQAAGWVLKVQSSSSGLDADDQLQILVYAQPKRGANAGSAEKLPTSAPVSPSPGPSRKMTPTSAPEKRPTTTPEATRTPALRLDGDRLLFTQAGANIEGVAAQNIEVPIPADRGYETLIITAVLGDFPRDCEGRTVNVRDFTELLVPPEITHGGAPVKPNGTLSCVTLAAPSSPSTPPSSALPER